MSAIGRRRVIAAIAGGAATSVAPLPAVTTRSSLSGAIAERRPCSTSHVDPHPAWLQERRRLDAEWRRLVDAQDAIIAEQPAGIADMPQVVVRSITIRRDGLPLGTMPRQACTEAAIMKALPAEEWMARGDGVDYAPALRERDRAIAELRAKLTERETRLEACGYAAIERDLDTVQARMDELDGLIAGTVPTTLDGLRAVVEWLCDRNAVDSGTMNGDGLDDEAFRSLRAGLAGGAAQR